MANKPNAKAKTKEQLAAGSGQAEPAAKKGSFKRTSEYGRQLHEKQKLKEMYGMREKQFRRFIKKQAVCTVFLVKICCHFLSAV